MTLLKWALAAGEAANGGDPYGTLSEAVVAAILREIAAAIRTDGSLVSAHPMHVADWLDARAGEGE